MLFNNIPRITKNKELLNVEYKPKKIIGREKEMSDLAFRLSYFFGDYPTLPKVIIHGSTGTGKTTVVNYILDEMKKEIKKQKKQIKIIKLKGSDAKTKFEVIKQIIKGIDPSVHITKNTSEMRDKLIDLIKVNGTNLLIFIDEVHCVNPNELNGILYFVSRLGEDLNYYGTEEKRLTENKKNVIGYILVSNEPNLLSLSNGKIQENTRSSITKDKLIFSRYSPEEVFNIVKSRINEGALKKDAITDVAINKIAAYSVKEGEDSRYAILLLSKCCDYAEEKGLLKIEEEVVDGVNLKLKTNLLKEIIVDYPTLHKIILSCIYELHKNKAIINSKSIYELYLNHPLGGKIQYSRVSQIVTNLEKDSVVYVISKRNNRTLSIKETQNEIFEVLSEDGYINGQPRKKTI